ncbi:hypothetical protein TrRE_jg3243 [Triparma retinervis]|uniref:Large ribosomal subunit protein bL12 C-terminal domain-containing protein n=1 Tax=Triparma retinervis TaxID=2557542 RepID=A0A9W7CMY8_9STRA|nr:hypothetical protein TrRE_jg3243 [Triparma retinervis]
MSLFRNTARLTTRIAFRSHIAPSTSLLSSTFPSLPQISPVPFSTRSFTSDAKPSAEANKAAPPNEDAPEGAIPPLQPDPVDGEVVTSDREEVKEEKTLFDLKLLSFDAKSKIKVIKEVRTITGLGLKEAKELVEGAPKTVKKDIKKEEAEELAEKIKAVGGECEVE